MYIVKVIKFLKIIFHISILFLIVISLYTGSLIGYLIYGDLERQPDIITNPFGTTINHFVYYFFVSALGLCLYIKSNNPRKLLSEVASKFYQNKPKNLLAVTGTNGKSSIADFYFQILNLNKKGWHQ